MMMMMMMEDQRDQQQLVRFWWRSESRCGYRIFNGLFAVGNTAILQILEIIQELSSNYCDTLRNQEVSVNKHSILVVVRVTIRIEELFKGILPQRDTAYLRISRDLRCLRGCLRSPTASSRYISAPQGEGIKRLWPSSVCPFVCPVPGLKSRIEGHTKLNYWQEGSA